MSRDASLQVKLGEVSSSIGCMSFTYVLEENGREQLQVYCYDPTDMRKSGVFLRLEEREVAKLEEILLEAKNATKRFTRQPSIQTAVAEPVPAALLGEGPGRLFQDAKEKLAAGNREGTIRILRQIVEHYPSSEWASKAKKSLADAGISY